MSQEIKDMSFEEAMAELETVVRRLESGKVRLDDAVAAYERGVRLKNLCAEKLSEAKAKIDKLIIGKDGIPVGMEAFDDELKQQQS